MTEPGRGRRTAGVGPERGRGRRAARAVRDTTIGNERRIGLWILPLFVLIGLLGATLAGGLAVLYYGQQVAELRATVTEARAQIDEAAAEVIAAAEEAEAAIADQVREVRESLAQGLPVGAPNDAGVYAVSARHPGGEVRVGSAFTVFSDSSETYLVTSYRLVRTPDGFAVAQVDVFIPGQTVPGRVHNFDRDRDLAVVVVSGGVLPVLEWRPPDQPIVRGDPIYLVGVAGPDTAAVVEGRVGAVGPEAIVPTVPANEFVSGGPLVDASGLVVAITTTGYAPFGAVEGNVVYAAPIRALCLRLIRCTRADLGVGSLGEEGGVGALPSPTETAPAPSPSPTDTATATPSPAPTGPPPPDGGEQPTEPPG